LDSNDALLILRVLEILEQPSGTLPAREETQAEDKLLASLPQAIYEVLAGGDTMAFRQAFEALSPEEQRRVTAVLEALQQRGEAAGEEQDSADTSLLMQFEPLLQAIAAASASGDTAQRQEIEQVLTDLEAQGWHLKESVERLWSGERDAEVLTEELDEQDSALIARVLELLDTQESSSAG